MKHSYPPLAKECRDIAGASESRICDSRSAGPHWHYANRQEDTKSESIHRTGQSPFERSIPINPVEVAISVAKFCVEVKRRCANFAFTIWEHCAEQSLIWPDYDLDIFDTCSEAVSADCEEEFAYTRLVYHNRRERSFQERKKSGSNHCLFTGDLQRAIRARVWSLGQS